MVQSLIHLPNVIVLAYLKVPKVAEPGPTDTPTDRPTEFAIAICHLVNTKCHKNSNIEVRYVSYIYLSVVKTFVKN